jgi:predicted nucleotidyltransferase
MAGHRSFKGLTKGFSPERAARVVARVAVLKKDMALHELRQARERSQEELARELKVGQPAVAKLERRADMYVSNLKRYVEALGGSLEITARFPDGVVNITNFDELGDTKAPEISKNLPKSAFTRPLKESFEPYRDMIRTAFIYGSFAKGKTTARSDIDLMVIGDGLDYSNLYNASQDAELKLERKVNPTFLSTDDWQRKAAQKGSFIRKVSSLPKIFIVGSEKDLQA